MKKTKLALFHSVIALMLCCSMLVGTTYAWFTDSVESANNVIKAGNLDVELQYSYDCENWAYVGADPIIDDTLWEPGHTEVVYLRVENAGTLALKYHLGINIVDEKGSYNQDRKAFLLSDYIQFGVVENVTAAYGTREAARAAVTSAKKISAGFDMNGSVLKGATDEVVALVVYMPEEVKNEANHATGVDAPEIKLGVNVYATQETEESDSFNSNYDAGATLPVEDLHFTVAMPIAGNVDAGALINEITLGSEEGDIFAEVPAGVKLAEGANALTLNVDTMDPADSQANVTLQAGEVATPINVHVDGLDNENNNVPLTITLKGLFAAGLNSGNYAMYHVENGVTVPMNLKASAAEVVAHNDYYYDVATGDVVMCAATFSEYVPVTDNKNLWKGNFDTSWYNTTATEFTLMTADQLAGFGAIVDGTAANIAADTFAGKTVKLGADIDLAGGYSLNPIGCGYAPETGVGNSNGVTGRPFKGTFDGQNHTISNLYQNGWDLGLSYCTLGGGLFASIANGTVQNLTITGADVRMECVEQGILVGLSQGTCTYDNIKIYNSKVANYQRATGGLIGEVTGAGTTNITNVVIGSDVVVGSLWGDFDAPVGGVIGARWANGNDNQIHMTNVTVAARLDVYNDVTSTYQWYAYRRAGMLIGNTEQVAEDGRTAAAPFLTCENVVVKYGDWIHYHYCEFNNHNSSWPWVRVEKGENCSAFSNPRYGVPNDPQTKQPVTGFPHSHTGDDECNVELTFGQLYGGGQGVYGGGQGEGFASTHAGVQIFDYYYTVIYQDRGKEFHKDEVRTLEPYTIGTTSNPSRNDVAGAKFIGWVNAGATVVSGTTIPVGNVMDRTYYDSWEKVYTARFVDLDGNVIYEEEFSNGASSLTEPNIYDAVEDLPDFTEKWESYDLKSANGDITIKPEYTYSGDLTLVPVDKAPQDGITDYYYVAPNNQVDDATVRIPGKVGVIPVIRVDRIHNPDGGKDWNNWNRNIKNIIVEEGVEKLLDNSLAYTPELTNVKLPSTITEIGKNVFSRNIAPDYKKLTIEFAGTMDEFRAIKKNSDWHNGLKSGSTVKCTDGTFILDAHEIVGIPTRYEWTPNL